MMDLIGTLANIIGLVSAIFAGLAWLAARRTRDELLAERVRLQRPILVELILESGDARRELDLSLRRSELTRAELLGRLGMLPMREPGRRFSLSYLVDPGFLRAVAVAQDGHGVGTIVIPCSAAEFAQFA